ncbi:DUF397 domain-containing protein [Streptomyces daliensis]|uniref:DUF397 domain-containing protein n=1 Tax=Streptomyces daliensis TaxID=299421 RepID=A0A8T4IW94_9ACTN|nr:DUF397 domain-containing protein [Streptomyces daliensis]
MSVVPGPLSGQWRKSSYSSDNGECVECAPLHGAAWRKSSYSTNEGGECVECAPLHGATWHKSSYSDDKGGSCVEVGVDGSTPVVAIRDSKRPDGPALTFPARAFGDFVRAVAQFPG